MKISRDYRKSGLAFAVLLMICSLAFAQLPKLPSLPEELTQKIPSLDDLLKGEPPVTTNLGDAVYGVLFLDDFDPVRFAPMYKLPRTDNGGFILRFPGLYSYDARSYCLKAGTYGPSAGDGYLFAPLKGPKSHIVQKIVEGSYKHLDIKQRDIQVLLWAVIARTKISDMPREMQLLAARLLSPKEIFELNGSALGLIPDEKRDELFSGVSPHIRRVLEAEADLRETLSRPSAAYEDLEQIAVLTGEPPEEDVQYIPSGRWSYHPDGFYIRYFPYSYTLTQIQIYVPEPFEISMDKLGRIISIENAYGDRIVTVYDDAIEPVTIPGEPSLKGYAFSSIHFETFSLDQPGRKVVKEWVNKGWTLCGVPTNKGQVNNAPGRFSNLGERYEKAVAHNEQIIHLDKQFSPQKDRNDVINIGHFAMALECVFEDDLPNTEYWNEYPMDLVKKAWQKALDERENSGTEAGIYLSAVHDDEFMNKSEPWSVSEDDNVKTAFVIYPCYQPSQNEAQPSGQKQRLKMSGVSKSDCDKVKAEIDHINDILDLLNKWDTKKEPDYTKWSNAAKSKTGGKAPMATDGLARLVPGEKRGTPGYEKDWAKWDALYNKYYGWTDAAEREFESYVKSQYFKGGPEIIWEAARGHERHHQNTLKDLYKQLGNMAVDTFNEPEFKKQEEIATYEEQKKKLQDWFNKHCK
jgi:hypothetical protein